MEIWFPIPSWLFWTFLGIGLIVVIFQKIFGESTDGSREVMPTPREFEVIALVVECQLLPV